MATSGSGASTFIVTIRPAASSGVVVGSTMRTAAESPTVAGASPRTASTAAAFVFLDPRTPEFLIPKIPEPSSVFDIFKVSSSIALFEMSK